MADTWELRFDLKAEDKNKSESFNFEVNALKDPSKEYPSFPKEKLLRALRLHGVDKRFKYASGLLKNIKMKKCPDLKKTDEIHLLMIILEKIGPISFIFSNKFEYLVLEGVDSQYNYIGYKTIVNLLIQTIKPDSEPIKGLGKIKAIYHATNAEEIERKKSYVPFLDTTEGNILAFALSVILPTVVVIVLPISWLDTMSSYLLVLVLLSFLVCLYPILKRSVRHSPLSLLSLVASYLIVESMIHVNFLIDGINPWGIFNNISRHNLVGILKNQPIVAAISPQLFIGFDLLAVIVPFLDVILLSLIPFTIGVSLSGFVEKVEKVVSARTVVIKTFFLAVFTIFIVVLPTTYHAFGKGMEGTFYAGIGMSETTEIFSDRFITDLEANFVELLSLIESANFNLNKAGNSFLQFAENPLIAYLLPSLIPEVAGIPLADLPRILDLTYVLSSSLEYIPNIFWALNNLQSGLNLSFSILQGSVGLAPLSGSGAAIFADYDPTLKDALQLLTLGTNNLSVIQDPLIILFDQVKEKLDYSVFAEISTVLTEIEIALPILITILDSVSPWINSTYKLSLVLDDLFDYQFTSEYLSSASLDFESASSILDIDIQSIPETTTIPIRDLVDFSFALHSVTKYFLFSMENGTQMFTQLNSTLRLFDDVDFTNTSNIDSPIWDDIDSGLNLTSILLNSTQDSLNSMNLILSSPPPLEFEELNDFFDELILFVDNTTESFDVVNQYFDALDGTHNSISLLSSGINVLNQTITQDLITSTEDYTNARNNFTQSQIVANNTYDILEGITSHILNESSITNWQNLIKGDITTNLTSSIYMNAEACLDLIELIETGGILVSHLTELALILVRIEDLDWNIF
ncbi:MAG: hypothetical protein ACXAC6_01790 [Candidatus Hodarchaeales archaeon]|jgi:hypothetical protein